MRKLLIEASWGGLRRHTPWGGIDVQQCDVKEVCIPEQFSALLQFLGGTNLLTGHTNEHWKAVRKAVAPSFSAGNMR